MRRASPILFGVCLLGIASSASAAEPTIQLRPDWQPGITQRIESTTSREREFNGEIGPKRTIHETIDCQIVSADSLGFVVDWKLVDGRVEGDARDPVTEALVNLWRGQSVVVEMGRDGTPRRLKNYEDLKHRLEFAVEAIVAQLRRQGGDKASTAAIGRKLLATFATERVATTALTRDLVLYFALLEKPLREDTPLELATTLANPLGDDPIPGLSTLAVTSLDPPNQQATITWTKSPDPDSSAQVLLGVAQQLARRLDRETPLGSEQSKLELQDTTTFVVDTGTGWVQSLKQTRELRFEDYLQRDTREMRLITAKQ
ncbi:MAG: hypothetical protein KF708_16155 [Pirellulales bacterium]|nr:hypothetical protein [Pirellulales bacterium]